MDGRSGSMCVKQGPCEFRSEIDVAAQSRCADLLSLKDPRTRTQRERHRGDPSCRGLPVRVIHNLPTNDVDWESGGDSRKLKLHLHELFSERTHSTRTSSRHPAAPPFASPIGCPG